jgi:cytochrome c553
MGLQKAVFTMLLLFCSLSSAWAADGKHLFNTCTACHGQKGEGNRALGAPNIAGMDEWYINKQLQDFASSRRGNKPGDTYGNQMRSIAVSTLSNSANRVLLATYIAKLPKTTPAASPKNTARMNIANGSTQYNALCSACHASNGKGNKPLGAPRLAGVDSVYLARQFANFRAGKRGSEPTDKLGKQMVAISKMLDVKAEQDVFAYISTLKP